MVKFPWAGGALALLVWTTPIGVRAEPAGSAAVPVIDALDHALLGVMQDAAKLGYQGRYAAFEPVIEQTFNIPLMTQLIVGPAWASWAPDQRDAMSDAFRRFITATYARRFDGYSGEDFVIDGERDGPNGTIILTRLTRPHDPAVSINYLMRDNGAGVPQVVDVYLTGTISELATRHSEFGAVLQHEGYAGLLAELEKKADGQIQTR